MVSVGNIYNSEYLSNFQYAKAWFLRCTEDNRIIGKKITEEEFEELKETIPDFHNTPKRFERFMQVVNEDKLGLAKNVSEEIDNARNAIGILGGRKPETVSFVLPNSDLKRINVKILKIKSTPKQYPRKAGTPTKKPL